MANKKLSNLAVQTEDVAGGDLFLTTDVVDNAGNANVSKSVTGTKLMALAPVQSVAGLTGTDTLATTNLTDAGTAATKNVGTEAGQVPLNSDLATVSQSGSYTDLINKPTLGTAAALNYGTSHGGGGLGSNGVCCGCTHRRRRSPR